MFAREINTKARVDLKIRRSVKLDMSRMIIPFWQWYKSRFGTILS